MTKQVFWIHYSQQTIKTETSVMYHIIGIEAQVQMALVQNEPKAFILLLHCLFVSCQVHVRYWEGRGHTRSGLRSKDRMLFVATPKTPPWQFCLISF